MKNIISAKIEQGVHYSELERRKSWEAIPSEGDVPTQERKCENGTYYFE